MLRSIAYIAGAVLLGWTPFAAAQNLLANGSFSEGAQDPDKWDHPSAERAEGGIRGGRDTSVYASAPASLRIEAIASGALGKSSQMISGLSPGNYRFTGKMKVTNAKAAGIAMVMFGSAGRQTGWNEVVFATGTTDWTDFDVITSLPPETQSVAVMPYADLRDMGRLWLDDLSFQRMAGAADRFTFVDFSGTALRSPYGSWVGRLSSTPEGMTIDAACDGGAALGRWVDVSDMGAYVPVLHVRALPANAARQLTMVLRDENKVERQWRFALPSSDTGMVPVLPDGFASLSKPNEGAATPWKLITDVRLKAEGDAATAVRLVVRGIEFGAPGQRIGAMPSKGPATQLPAAARASASPAGLGEIVAMTQMLLNSNGYGSWAGKASNVRSDLQVLNGNSQGGVVYHGTWDLSAHKGQMPAMTLKVLPGNQAPAIRFMPEDASGKTDIFTYDLPAPSDRTVTLLPHDRKRFGDNPAFALNQVRKYHIQGTYENTKTISVMISKVEYVPGAR